MIQNEYCAACLKQLCKYFLKYLYFSEGITTLFDVHIWQIASGAATVRKNNDFQITNCIEFVFV